MIIEIVSAGLILMLVWWLFKSGLAWSILVVLILGILFLLNAPSEGIFLVY